MKQMHDGLDLLQLANGAITYDIREEDHYIAVDMDGTLARFDEWRGVDHIGLPLQSMIARITAWLAKGQPVRIFTARVDDILKFIGDNEHKFALEETNELPYELQRKVDIDRKARQVIEQWCLQHIGVVLPITNRKDVLCKQIWDDIAVQMVPNTGETLAVPEQAEYLADKGATPVAVWE